MGISLPKGFSPWQAVQQVVDDANPFDGGRRDRDVFSEVTSKGTGEWGQQYGSGAGRSGYLAPLNTGGSNQQSTVRQGHNNTEPLFNSGIGNGTGGGSGAAGSWTPQDQASYDQALQIANSNLGRIGGQTQTALSNIAGQYGQKSNALASGLRQATNQYNEGNTSNQQADVTNKNVINQQAAQGLRGLLRSISAAGGGGGSAYLYEAPQVVGEVAQSQLGESGKAYAENARALDSNFGLYKDENEGQRKDLGDWRKQQENAARTQAEQTKQSLLQKIAQLQGQRDVGLGGTGVAAMQPYINQINSSQNTVDQLAKFNPTFDGKLPEYNAPELSKFMMGENPQIAMDQASAAAGARTPYMDLILGRKKQEQEQLV